MHKVAYQLQTADWAIHQRVMFVLAAIFRLLIYTFYDLAIAVSLKRWAIVIICLIYESDLEKMEIET